jgi:hypothetical protein
MLTRLVSMPEFIDAPIRVEAAGEPPKWVRYSTPDGAEYVAVCLPAFSPDTVNRDE